MRLYVLLPAALIGPPTFMAGFSFPLLQRAVQTDLAQLGRRVGTLLAANILGSTVGAFVTGWVLLDFLGTAGTLKSLFILSAGFGAIALRESTRPTRWSVRAAASAVGVLVAASVVLAMPGRQLLWATLHGTTPTRVLVAEDGSGLSLLYSVMGVCTSSAPAGNTTSSRPTRCFRPAPTRATCTRMHIFSYSETT